MTSSLQEPSLYLKLFSLALCFFFFLLRPRKQCLLPTMLAPSRPFLRRDERAALIERLLLKHRVRDKALHLGGKLIVHKQEHISSGIRFFNTPLAENFMAASFLSDVQLSPLLLWETFLANQDAGPPRSLYSPFPDTEAAIAPAHLELRPCQQTVPSSQPLSSDSPSVPGASAPPQPSDTKVKERLSVMNHRTGGNLGKELASTATARFIAERRK